MKNTSLLLASVVVVALGMGCQTAKSSKMSTRATARAAQAQSTGKVHTVPASTTLYFESNEFQLAESSMDLLDRYALVLAKNPSARITITGHTDEVGPTEYNLMLGEARARAARKYLIDLGANPSQVRIVSLGEERPAVVGRTEEAWSKNRRDELYLAFGQ
ncbi:MAG: OmpA family protein [Deltaproteobacteria bacterium]|nr:OmpA family protein [Deltaproteobacteria bacterium]